MFCKKCGAEIEDGMVFCTQCGNPVQIQESVQAQAQSVLILEPPAQVQEQPVPIQMQTWQQPIQPAYQTPPQKKEKKATGLIIGLVVLLLCLIGGAGGVFFWFNRPIYKIQKAMEQNDIATVVTLYDKLTKKDDKTLVQAGMLDYAKELKNDYLDKNADYDDVMDIYEKLERRILADNDYFGQMQETVEKVEVSRAVYAEAEKLFEAQEYAEAKARYLEVAKEDPRYDEAMQAADKCEEKIQDMLIGTWYMVQDMGKMYAESANTDYIYLPTRLEISFKENGICTTSFKPDDMDVWKKSLTKYLKNSLKDYDVTEEELESIMPYLGYSSVDEWMDSISERTLESFDFQSDAAEDYKYTFDGETIVITEKDGTDPQKITVDITKDTMTFISSDRKNRWDQFDGPMEFKRDAGI